jgi:hypothetical protein
LLQLLLIDGRTKAALFDSLNLNGFWPGLQDWFQTTSSFMSTVRALEDSIADSLRVLLVSNSIGLATLKLATHTQGHETW